MKKYCSLFIFLTVLILSNKCFADTLTFWQIKINDSIIYTENEYQRNALFKDTVVVLDSYDLFNDTLIVIYYCDSYSGLFSEFTIIRDTSNVLIYASPRNMVVTGHYKDTYQVKKEISKIPIINLISNVDFINNEALIKIYFYDRRYCRALKNIGVKGLNNFNEFYLCTIKIRKKN